MSRHLEPAWVNDYEHEDDDRDPDHERDQAADRAADETYDRWVEAHMGWSRDD